MKIIAPAFLAFVLASCTGPNKINDDIIDIDQINTDNEGDADTDADTDTDTNDGSGLTDGTGT
ncbi:MAG: hypothetical protein H0V89_01710 [Deltaproteobacteria bacterium]|nr:hypothetical protein [Deltaproteobacteria bacterium]